MGRIVGFEPTTAGATDRCSTTELYPPCRTSILAEPQERPAEAYFAHDPGPRGSPQWPQPPPPRLADPADFAKSPLPFTDPTANDDSNCSSFVPLHAGQCAFADPVIMASNCLSQDLHTYSKIGTDPLRPTLANAARVCSVVTPQSYNEA